MVSSTADPKHVIIIAQDVATYKVMDFLDVRCTGLAQGQNARADLYFPPAMSVMDANPMIIQLVDGLQFPILPRDPSADDPLNVWYIEVFQLFESFLISIHEYRLVSIPACLYLLVASFPL